MNIEKNKVVLFHYTLTDSDGTELESITSEESIAYLHGANNIFSDLEKALEGKQQGDQLNITLAPEQGYGLRRDNALQRIPVKHLHGPKNKKWRPGDVAVVSTEQGQKQVTLAKVGKFMVTIDGNHPYAGKTVTFDIVVDEVRDATGEELAHKHAHGRGGHHH